MRSARMLPSRGLMRSVPSQRASFSSVILLVDDNPDGSLARGSVLSELGYQILTARCGQEALALVKNQPVNLIITDYKMDPVNGLELIALLRAEGYGIPVILLTGFAESLGLRPDATGANVVIQKSANELAILLRHTRRLLQPPRKPAKSHSPTKLASRSHTAGS